MSLQIFLSYLYIKYEHDQFIAWPGMANKASKRPFANECKWQLLSQWNWSTWKNSYRTWFNVLWTWSCALRSYVRTTTNIWYVFIIWMRWSLSFLFFLGTWIFPCRKSLIEDALKSETIDTFFFPFCTGGVSDNIIMQYLMEFRDTPWLLIFFFGGGGDSLNPGFVLTPKCFYDFQSCVPWIQLCVYVRTVLAKPSHLLK